MTIELIKEVKVNGDVFFSIYTDGSYYPGSAMYGQDKYDEVVMLYEKIKNHGNNTREVLKSDEIFVNL